MRGWTRRLEVGPTRKPVTLFIEPADRCRFTGSVLWTIRVQPPQLLRKYSLLPKVIEMKHKVSLAIQNARSSLPLPVGPCRAKSSSFFLSRISLRGPPQVLLFYWCPEVNDCGSGVDGDHGNAMFRRRMINKQPETKAPYARYCYCNTGTRTYYVYD